MKWIVLLLILPAVTAGILPPSCENAPVDYEECQHILSDTTLSQTKKEDLYLNLLNPQTDLPAHDFVWSWNNQIMFSNPPDGKSTSSNGTIQNAWLKIIGINKSTFDSNQQKWFAQKNGQIQTVKHHDLQIPSETLPGECQTTYGHNIQQNQLTVYANGQNVGNTTITSYDTELDNQNDLNFLVEWNLATQLTTHHYHNQQHCFFDGWNWYCWYTCDYTNTTYDNYSVNLQDELPTTVLDFDYNIQTAIDTQATDYKLYLDISLNEPLNQITLEQNGKQFIQSQARYDLNTSLAPYGALFVKRIPENKTKSDFLVLDHNQNRIELATDSNQDCQLTILTDFDEYQQPCNSILLKKTRIELQADQNHFDTNETIQLQAILFDDQNNFLTDRAITFATKNVNKTVLTNENGTANWNIPANQSNGVIQSIFLADNANASSQATLRVPVSDSDLTPKAYNVSVFFLAYYVLFAAFKRKFGVF